MSNYSNAIRQRLLLLKLIIHEPKMSVGASTISAEVAKKHGMNPDMLRASMMLYPPEAIKPIKRIHTLLRNTHYSLTAYWADRGLQAIAASMLERPYKERMKPLLLEARAEHEKFCRPDRVENVISQAKALLGSQFRESNYPATPQEMLEQFSVDIIPVKVPEGDDFRIDIPAAMLEEARQKIDEDSDTNIHLLHRSLWEKAFKTLNKVATGLENYDPESGIKGFHQSTLDKIAEMADVLDQLNVMEDGDLTQLSTDIRYRLTNLNAASLKKDDEEREKKRKYVEKLKNKALNKLERFSR